MANIVIKELLAADTVSDLVDKVNFNFDQLLLNGGGPMGMIGTAGPLGPAGPRGAIWFTLRDLYNTSTTTVGLPGSNYFPLWNGTPQKVNDSTQPNYPQWYGDPNKYGPVATTSSPNTYPAYSFTMGTIGKLPRSGDFYLQEADDTFNGYSSLDGDVWEYNSIGSTWTFTGVNIKGNTGTGGVPGATDWVRTTDNISDLNDILRPKVVTGHSADVRLLLGIDNVASATEVSGTYTNNTLTLYQDGIIAAGGLQIAMTDNNSQTSDINGVPTSDYARIGTLNNILYIEGFGDQPGTQYAFNIDISARAGDVNLASYNNPYGTTATSILSSADRKFEIGNAELQIYVDPTYPKAGVAQRVQHFFRDDVIGLEIIHNQSSALGGWNNKTMRINSYDVANTDATDIIFQDNDTANSAPAFRNIGIGEWASGRPSGRLSITQGYTDTNNASIQPALAIGYSWSNTSNTPAVPRLQTVDGITSSIQTWLRNSAFIQGGIVTGGGISLYDPVMYGISAVTANNPITVTQGLVGFNSYIDKTSTGNTISIRSIQTVTGSYFIGNGDNLLNSITGSITNDLENRFVIGGSSTSPVLSTPNNPLTGSLQGSQPYNINFIIDSINNSVGINTSFINQSDFTVAGGAIIGKVKNYSSHSLVGHIDAAANKNVIIGYSTGSTSSDPYINVLNATWSTPRSTYIATPLWSSAIQHDSVSTGGTGVNDITCPTLDSFSSNAAGGYFVSYYKSGKAQNKVVHGNTINLSGYTGQLGPSANPYDIGVGLEIETKILTTTTLGNSYSSRSPISRDGKGNIIPGNRPIIVNRRGDSNVSDLLFHITPFGNTSIGSAIKYPDYSIFELENSVLTFGSPATVTPSGSAITPQGIILLAPDINTSKWWKAFTVVPQTFILPSVDRSLHVSYLTAKDVNKLQDSIDIQRPKIKAGIIMDNIVFNAVASTTAPSINVSTIYTTKIYNHYLTDSNDTDLSTSYNYGYYRPQVTTAPVVTKAHDAALTTRQQYVVGAPLGIKPGSVNYIFDSVEVNLGKADIIKGADTLISAGDIIATSMPRRTIQAGDVYVFGGAIYTNSISAGIGNNVIGYDAGKTMLGNGDTQPARNVGNIFIGSRPDNGAQEIFPGSETGISKAGLVYIGYDSNSTQAWTKSQNGFIPKGTAALNVTGDFDTITDRILGIGLGTISTTNTYSNDLLGRGKAINIQRGDIVTKNEDAGWVSIDLTQQPYLSNNGTPAASTFSWVQAPVINATIYESNVLRVYQAGAHGNGKGGGLYSKVWYWDSTGTNRGGGSMTEVKPKWEFRYKVIGYTVFYKLTLQSILLSTIGDNTAASLLSLYGPSLFNVFNSLGKRIPKPLVLRGNTTIQDAVYPAITPVPDAGGNFYGQNSVPLGGMNSAVQQTTFGGSGLAVWRNARNYRTNNQPYPLPLAGSSPSQTGQQQNTPVLVTPVSVNYTIGHPYLNGAGNTDSYINIFKIGTPTWPQYGATATNGFNVHNTMFRLFNLEGVWDPTGTGGIPYNIGAMLQYDLITEGSYELDPTEYWSY